VPREKDGIAACLLGVAEYDVPNTTWSICSGLTPERFIASFEATTPRSIAVMSRSEPQNDPSGVLAPSMSTISFCIFVALLCR
jgi:hypothetical protein